MFRFPSRLLCRRSFHRRHFHSTTTPPLQLPLSFPIYLIWGSNTAVGKTLVSAGVAASQLLSSPTLFHYIKPVQTGFPIDSDSRFVFNKVSALFLRRNPSFSLFASNLILNASGPASNAAGETEGCGMEMSVLNWREENKLMGEKNGCSELICKTMYAWEEAVSPHLAAERESGTVKDSVVLETLQRCFRDVLEGGADKGESEVLCACCITHYAVTMVILSGKGGWCRHSHHTYLYV